MKWHRIYGMLLRYMYYFRRSYDRMSDVFYWPLIDLLLWGLTSTYLRTYTPHASALVLIIISGLLLWIIVWRAQYEISVNLLQEIWDRNLVNLFVSPLKFREWIASLLIVGIVKGVISIVFASLVAFGLYKIHLFYYGFHLIPFLFLLILSGWWIGFLISGILLRYGTKVQTFAWTLPMVFSPFTAIFYPVSILPVWAQKVALFVPMSYIFEGARQVINTGKVDPNKLIICFILNVVYLLITGFFLYNSFKKVLQRGLVNTY